ncbi:hypothetical protein AAHC03_027008 [Spirometra sp. Aus1]
MLGLQFLGLFLLIQFAYGNGDEDLIPREFTATPLNSTSIFVSWEEPNRSSELSGEYQINVSSSTHERQYHIRGTAGTFRNLEPSTNHTFTVRAFWKNDTPVDAVAFAFAETRPHETDLESSMSPNLPEEEVHTEGNVRSSTNSPSETKLDNAEGTSLFSDLPEEEVHPGNSTNSPDEITFDNGQASFSSPNLPTEDVHTEVNSDISTNSPNESPLDNDAETLSSALSTLSETAETDGLDDALSSAPSIALCAKLANFFIIFVSLMGLRYL